MNYDDLDDDQDDLSMMDLQELAVQATVELRLLRRQLAELQASLRSRETR